MKLLTIIGWGAGALAAAVTGIWFGIYNIAANEKHWGATTQVLEIVRERSVYARSKGLSPPILLESPQRIAKGAINYAAMCAQCHLAPGMEATELNLGLYPSPPRFFDSEHLEHQPSATFWVIKNGIKLTGMPAWGDFHSDSQIWDLVAFIRKLPDMSKEEYARLAKVTERNPEDTNHALDENSQHEH